MTTPLRALALVCSLKPSPADSSSDLIARRVLAELAQHDVVGEAVRLVDHDVKPGVETDTGPGDAWPAIREKVLAADILVMATPTWMGQASSVCMRALERLDAELSEKDDEGRPSVFGKVAVAAIVGNEDGAHHISSQLFQALNDVGYSIPAQGATYWNGEAMHGTDYKDWTRRPRSPPAPTRPSPPTRRTSRASCRGPTTRVRRLRSAADPTHPVPVPPLPGPATGDGHAVRGHHPVTPAAGRAS